MAADGPPRRARSLLPALLIATSLAVGAGCTASDGSVRNSAGTADVGAADVGAADVGAADVGTTDIGSADVGTADSNIPAADETAIRSTIDAMNLAAGGGVAGQQAELAALVDPAVAAALDDCPPTITTLRFEPVYQALRPSPGWAGSAGALGGTVYALPTLIKIYTGDRITGTDLTTLHLGVQAGEAYLTPLCVG